MRIGFMSVGHPQQDGRKTWLWLRYRGGYKPLSTDAAGGLCRQSTLS